MPSGSSHNRRAVFVFGKTTQGARITRVLHQAIMYTLRPVCVVSVTRMSMFMSCVDRSFVLSVHAFMVCCVQIYLHMSMCACINRQQSLVWDIFCCVYTYICIDRWVTCIYVCMYDLYVCMHACMSSNWHRRKGCVHIPAYMHIHVYVCMQTCTHTCAGYHLRETGGGTNGGVVCLASC